MRLGKYFCEEIKRNDGYRMMLKKINIVAKQFGVNAAELEEYLREHYPGWIEMVRRRSVSEISISNEDCFDEDLAEEDDL